MKYLSFIITAILFISLCSCKDKVGRADDLRIKNKFEEAAKLYKQAADEGNSYAKWRLARAYGKGDGVNFDEEMALSLLEEASSDGCPQATCDLAYSYIYGWYGQEKNVELGKNIMEQLCAGTDDSYSLAKYAIELMDGEIFEQDKDKAQSILNKIKDKEEPEYLIAMYVTYFDGTDEVEVDKEKAIRYLKKAYKNGSGRSATILGNVFLGDYPPLKKDVDEAIKWYEKGIERNSTNSMIQMASICLAEDSIYKKWHDVNRGISLLEKACRHGDSDAYAQLGLLYSEGNQVPLDEHKSFEYYKTAAKLKSGWGTNNLGACYFNGTGCEIDREKAIELFKIASELGEGKASDNLYLHYFNSNDTILQHENLRLAKEYLLLSVKQGDKSGYFHLGTHYYHGTILFEKNLIKAFNNLKQAADLGDINACQMIAYMYEKGEGCERNPIKAKEYRDKTIAKDDSSNPNKKQ